MADPVCGCVADTIQKHAALADAIDLHANTWGPVCVCARRLAIGNVSHHYAQSLIDPPGVRVRASHVDQMRCGKRERENVNHTRLYLIAYAEREHTHTHTHIVGRPEISVRNA